MFKRLMLKIRCYILGRHEPDDSVIYEVWETFSTCRHCGKVLMEDHETGRWI